MFKCRLCNKEMKAITPSHLDRVHGITKESYQKQFPNDILTSPVTTAGYGNGNRGKKLSKQHAARIGAANKKFHQQKNADITNLLDDILGEK